MSELATPQDKTVLALTDDFSQSAAMQTNIRFSPTPGMYYG